MEAGRDGSEPGTRLHAHVHLWGTCACRVGCRRTDLDARTPEGYQNPAGGVTLGVFTAWFHSLMRAEATFDRRRRSGCSCMSMVLQLLVALTFCSVLACSQCNRGDCSWCSRSRCPPRFHFTCAATCRYAPLRLLPQHGMCTLHAPPPPTIVNWLAMDLFRRVSVYLRLYSFTRKTRP